jgi:hypothetical protein
MGVVRVLTRFGDESIEYEPALDDGRLKRARALFDSKIASGYLAFVPDEAGTGGTQIRRFDPAAREIILQPAISGG